MGKNIKVNLTVEVSDIQIDDRYYSFNYKVNVNGVLFKQSNYSNSHCWGNNKKEFRSILKEYYAFNLVLENLNLSK